MNAKNLPLKFAFVALLVAVCLYSLYAQGLQYGIDLQGGHSLIFEIRKTSQAEIDARKADLAAVEAKLKSAKTDKEKATLQQQVDNLKAEIDKLSETVGSENLAEKMIEILKERIDPQGLANLEWRPVGTDRIEVRMPAARAETRQRQEVYDTAMRKLAESNVSRAQRRNYLYGSADQRKQILSELKDPNQSQALEQLGTAFDTERAAEKALRAAQARRCQAVAKAQAAYDTARAEYRTKQLEEADASIRIPHLEGILRNYRSPAEQEGLSDTEKADLKAQFEKDLTDLEKEHPGRKALIEDVVAAYKSWAAVRHRLSDPTDLERRIARAGVLEFRIVAGDQGEPLTRDQRQQYVDLLEQEGPGEARRRGMPFAWFPIRGTDRKSYGGMVTAEYAGKWYLLLSNQKGYKMTRDTAEGGWSLDSARRGADDMGRPAIDFTFDEAGAKKFYALTSANMGKAMAILLDDEVFSAPRINSAISNRGQITGKFTNEEVDENVKLLQAGSLPARLNPTPVAVRSFGPTLGKENRDAGIRAAYMGMICVAAFMLIYYLLAGMIADVALVLNIILVLGAMSLLSAVFTLPGIAGVILTIGIAVDANVLIFERLREEQAKGQTVRMALKNAYERGVQRDLRRQHHHVADLSYPRLGRHDRGPRLRHHAGPGRSVQPVHRPDRHAVDLPGPAGRGLAEELAQDAHAHRHAEDQLDEQEGVLLGPVGRVHRAGHRGHNRPGLQHPGHRVLVRHAGDAPVQDRRAARTGQATAQRRTRPADVHEGSQVRPELQPSGGRPGGNAPGQPEGRPLPQRVRQEQGRQGRQGRARGVRPEQAMDRACGHQP